MERKTFRSPKEDGITHILGSKLQNLYITNRFAPVGRFFNRILLTKQAGLQKGDKIVALNGKTIDFMMNFLMD